VDPLLSHWLTWLFAELDPAGMEALASADLSAMNSFECTQSAISNFDDPSAACSMQQLVWKLHTLFVAQTNKVVLHADSRYQLHSMTHGY